MTSRIRTAPSTGMRGGLGRTLLTALLLLAIGPLSLVGYVAFNQVRAEKQRDTVDRLAVAAQLEEARVRDWLNARRASLESVANDPAGQRDWVAADAITRSSIAMRLASISERDTFFVAVFLVVRRDQENWIAAQAGQLSSLPQGAALPREGPVTPVRWRANDAEGALFELAVPVRDTGSQGSVFIVGLARFKPGDLPNKVIGLGRASVVYLTNLDQQTLTLQGALTTTVASSQGAALALAGQNGSATYKGLSGVPVIGVYRRLDDWDSALVAEQDVTEAFARSDELAAGLIGAVLGVALLTTVIAAVVTRQITRPIVLLTEAALKMSGGDWSARVAPTRRDEIGILGSVFNTMASELSGLYTGLEQKVTERTGELQKAKEQIQYHAWQLSISAEVGRITTSILDLNTLLERASELIRDAFQLDRVGVYLLKNSGDSAFLFNSVGRAVPAHEQQLHLNSDHPVSMAITLRTPRKLTRLCGDSSGEAVCELVLPLAIGAKTIGALDLTTRDTAGFNESDQSVLQTLADQMSVAIENARTYSQEHEAADEMREIDRLRGQFLMRMSHQLATYLNTILGFSKLLLKGVDGRLNETQTQDLTAIRHSSQQLKQLLDDILELANLEVSAIELERAPIDVAELVKGLRGSLNSLLVNPQLRLEMQVEPDCPPILADADRLRQVLTNLVLTAAGMSREGILLVRVALTPEGSATPHQAGQVAFEISAPASAAGLGGALAPAGSATPHAISLALSRRLVDLHGGRLQVQQHENGKTDFSFSLPLATTPVMEN